MDTSKLFLSDPVTGQKSVSLTLLAVSFVVSIAANVAVICGKSDSTASVNELTYAMGALYFGRRISSKKGAPEPEKESE